MLESDNADYLKYTAPVLSGSELAQLSELAELQAKSEAEIADLEARLTKAREVHRDLAERQVPELMDKVGMSEFKTTSGLKIEVNETIRASISKAAAGGAFAWLKAHGHSALIKRLISVSFGKGEDEKADELKAQLNAYEVDDVSNVHPATLSAFVREKLQKGEDIPLDLLGVHRQRVAKIKN